MVALERSDQPKVYLVLEGGGVKGIGLVGAVLAMSQKGYVFPRVAGTSAGAGACHAREHVTLLAHGQDRTDQADPLDPATLEHQVDLGLVRTFKCNHDSSSLTCPQEQVSD